MGGAGSRPIDRSSNGWTDGLYHSLDAPGLSLGQLAAIAASIDSDPGEGR